MKLAMSSWSHHGAIKSGEMSQGDWIAFCALLRLDAVELLDLHFPSTDNSCLDDIRRVCSERGLEIACVAVSNDFGLPVKKARGEMERLVRKWIGLCVRLGAPLLRVFAGLPGAHKKGLHLVEKFRLWDEMCERLNRLATEGKKAGVTLAIENHNGNGFTKTVDDLFSILDAAPDLGVCLDTGDYLVGAADVNGYAALERAAPKAVHVHAKLYDLDDEGRDSKQDWRRILDILTAAGFKGALSIEYEGAEDPLKALPRGINYLANLMREKGLRP